jgi:hypothetical protein
MLTGRDLLEYFLMVYNASNRMSRSPMNDQLRFQVQLEVRRRIRLCIFVHNDLHQGKNEAHRAHWPSVPSVVNSNPPDRHSP